MRLSDLERKTNKASFSLLYFVVAIVNSITAYQRDTSADLRACASAQFKFEKCPLQNVAGTTAL